jgi:hypothetical protein
MATALLVCLPGVLARARVRRRLRVCARPLSGAPRASTSVLLRAVRAVDGVSYNRLHKHIVDGRWHGVLVEPQAEHFGRLVANYEGLEGLTFINAAVDRERGSCGRSTTRRATHHRRADKSAARGIREPEQGGSPERGYDAAFADVAQLVEHWLPKPGVAGSNPVVRLQWESQKAPITGAFS